MVQWAARDGVGARRASSVDGGLAPDVAVERKERGSARERGVGDPAGGVIGPCVQLVVDGRFLRLEGEGQVVDEQGFRSGVSMARETEHLSLRCTSWG